MKRNSTQIIHARKVLESHRTQFLYKKLGTACVAFENTVYPFMQTFCKSYTGGYWEFYDLDNGGFYMCPPEDVKYDFFVEMNGFEGVLSAKAAGVVVTLLSLNYILCHISSEKIVELYYQLLDYAELLPESGLIFKALD